LFRSTVIVFSSKANRKWVRFYYNFQIIVSVFCMQVHIYHQTQKIPNLIGQIFQKFFGIIQLFGFPLVINTDIQSTTLSIRKTTNPFEIVIVPRLFPLYILMFLAMLAHSLKLSVIIISGSKVFTLTIFFSIVCSASSFIKG